MIDEIFTDIAVIGGGAAGLAAATAAARAGKQVRVIDRAEQPGGILRQCIHNGFGLHYFKTELTGPEYAWRVAAQARQAGVELQMSAAVTAITRNNDGTFTLTVLSAADGVNQIHARAIVMAMGCRERNRGNLAIPGSRPAGVFTAGAAQKLLNQEGLLPGKRAVIVGSGDIGLIMARRLRWCGIAVCGVFEILPTPSGLTRNVVQCLEDFQIPLHLEHAVIHIAGHDRVEYIEAAPLQNGVPKLTEKFRVDCDTVLFSVGLIPENELARELGVTLNPATGGARVGADYQTSVPGVFAGGNVLHVHDLVDFVSEEAAAAGAAAAAWLDGAPTRESAPVTTTANLKYVIPNAYFPGRTTKFSFRPLIAADRATLELSRGDTTVWSRSCRYVRPAEMLNVEIPAETLSQPEALSFRLLPEVR